MALSTDVLRRGSRDARGVGRVAGWLPVVLVVAGMSPQTPTHVVQGAEAAQPQEIAQRVVLFKGSVLKEPIRRLSLLVNETMLIRTDVACQRVDAKPDKIIRYKLVNPYEIFVAGAAAGNAELRLHTEDGKTPVFKITVKPAPAKTAKEDQPFKVGVRVAPVQRFTLKINKSMLVQTNFPCRRVQALSPAPAGAKDQKQTVTETERVSAEKTRSVRREEPVSTEEEFREIIQAEIVTPTEVLIVGRWFGTAQLLLFTEDNEVQILEIAVEADVEQLNEVISTELPKADVRAKSVRQAIVLEGRVPDEATKNRVMEIATIFAKEEGLVKDHITLDTVTTQPLDAAALEAKMQLNMINSAIQRLVVDNKADVNVKKIMDTFVIEGRVPDVETAERIQEIIEIFGKGGGMDQASKVVNHLQVAGVQQVLLQCTVAEVSKSAIRELGINGWLAGDNVRDMFVVNQVGQINPSNIGAAADALVAPAVRGGVPPKVPFLTDQQGIPLLPTTPLSVGFPRVQMQLFIQALRENGLTRILAEPNLVAINGQTATFHVGGEFAYPIPQEGGVPAVEFKEFGVRLLFTPTVLANQRIRLRIMPEVSQPDDSIGTTIQGTRVPGKTTRQFETVVEIGNGQTLALAGLLNDQIRGVAQKIPGLGDVPVLGALFSSVRYQRNQTELLVLCTPQLVSPMNPDQVPSAPGEELTSPNDWQLFALGELEGKKNPAPTAPEKALKTAVPVRSYKTTANGSSGLDKLSLHGPWGPAEGNENF